VRGRPEVVATHHPVPAGLLGASLALPTRLAAARLRPLPRLARLVRLVGLAGLARALLRRAEVPAPRMMGGWFFPGPWLASRKDHGAAAVARSLARWDRHPLQRSRERDGTAMVPVAGTDTGRGAAGRPGPSPGCSQGPRGLHAAGHVDGVAHRS
jgi:hypothetical protein